MATKDKVLGLLRTQKTGEAVFVSGGSMSKELGISRMAVNKAIQALRGEGYEIESINNRGYRLLASPDHLNTAELSCFLSGERMERVLCLDTVSSTNVRLSELSYEGVLDGFTVISNEQTGGRGRRGRSFASPKDKGIYLSYLMRRTEAPSDVSQITAWTAVAVCEAIEEVLGERKDRVGIKWVNDLVMGGKKLCGILTEMSVENETGRIESIIIGIGVNVNEEASDFDEELSGIATSLYLETGQKIKRSELAAAMIRRLDRMNLDFPKKLEEYLSAYRERCIICGKEIKVYDAKAMDPGDGKKSLPRTGKAMAINDDFSLKVRYENGELSDLNSGEISVRL